MPEGQETRTDEPGNALPESQGEVRPPEGGGEAQPAEPVATGPAGAGVPEAPAPWTHHLDGRRARVVEADESEVMFEVAIPDDDPRTATAEPGMMSAEEWAERAVPFTVDQAAEQPAEQPEAVRPPDKARTEEPAAEQAGAVGARPEPTVTELAAVAGVTIEKLPDGSFVLRGADLPKGGLFVEADKLREVALRVADGTWREV